ncbi:hypothetical protein WMQ48_17685 [Vibrio cidicii]|uniref:hypothetical protein n=1 Tax=Vibrio cidicii TaxID=1763883 RepID=UPI0037535B75
MENSVENLYVTIAQSIVNSIDDDWSMSIIRAELTEGSIEFQSEYIPTLSPEQKNISMFLLKYLKHLKSFMQ